MGNTKKTVYVPGINPKQTSIFFKLLAISTALAWPVFTVLPEARFGGILLPNAFLYFIVLLLSVASLPRQNLSKVLIAVLVFWIIFYFPPTIQSLYFDIPGGGGKSVDILITHLIFILAGISAGNNYPVFVKYFFSSLLIIIVANLAFDLMQDFAIQNRESIGVFGGQGFSRIVVVTAMGLITTTMAQKPRFRTLRSVVIIAATFALALFAGARSSLLGFSLALIVYYLFDKNKLILTFIVFSIIIAGLLYFYFPTYYLEILRPAFIQENPSGLARTVLTLDILFLDQVGPKYILSALERLNLWAESIRIVTEYPLGAGFGGFEVHSTIGHEKYPHNFILEVLVEMGIGVGSFYLLLLATLVFLSPRAVLPYLIILLVFLSFSGNLVDARQLMLFLGLTLHHLFCEKLDSPNKSFYAQNVKSKYSNR